MMPVRKFHDVSEMEDTWLAPGSAELQAAIRRVWDFGARLIRPRFPPGVHKHRSADALDAASDRWEAINVTAYRARITSA